MRIKLINNFMILSTTKISNICIIKMGSCTSVQNNKPLGDKAKPKYTIIYNHVRMFLSEIINLESVHNEIACKFPELTARNYKLYIRSTIVDSDETI